MHSVNAVINNNRNIGNRPMGLDQYARTQKIIEHPNKPDEKIQNEFAYWRKHNRLQGWMESLFWEKVDKGILPTPEGNSFNCVDLPLTESDLDNLEEAVRDKNLKTTQGFFFGNEYDYDDETQKTDLDFIERARDYMADDFTIIYSCWW